MKKRLTLASAALMAVILTTGCGANVNNSSKPAADVMNATQPVHKNQVGVGDRQHVQMATKVANDLVKKGYAKHAFVFTVGTTAYVAVDQVHATKTHQGLQNKQKITDAVKKMDKRIKTVYVSANPNAYHRFKSFADEVNAGKPVSAIWDNFRTSVASLFPTAH